MDREFLFAVAPRVNAGVRMLELVSRKNWGALYMWKLGFLGFLGLLGLLGLRDGYEALYGLYGLFGFYGFFGMQNRNKGK